MRNEKNKLFKILDFIPPIMYNSLCTLRFTFCILHFHFEFISRCGSIWGRFRAPPVADAARNEEWRNKEYREVDNERDDYIATGRALRSGKRSPDGSSKKQKPP